MLLRGKIDPENRVNIFLSYKSAIKKPDNSIGLYVINSVFCNFINGKQFIVDYVGCTFIIKNTKIK